MINFLLWCILLVLCWPIAILVLLLWPIIWLLILPFRLLGLSINLSFAVVTAILLLPFTLLGRRAA